MSQNKKVELIPHMWITKEDWDICNKFHEKQQIKLYEFIFKFNKEDTKDKNATTETD